MSAGSNTKRQSTPDNVVALHPKPKTHCCSLDNLPPALRALTRQRRWVVWK